MDSQKPGYRTVQKKVRMKKWIAIPVTLMVLVVIAVGTFVGMKALGGNDTPSVATEPSESVLTEPIAPTDPITITDTHDTIDYEKEYADVPDYLRDHVMLYAEALYENWPQEKWERFGLSLELYLVKDQVECGFVMKDLDSDGFQDLIIYGDSQLYQILAVEHWPDNLNLEAPEYTILNIAYEYDQAEITLCEDNVIMVTNFVNDRDYYASFNRLGKSEYGRSTLNMIETVFAIDGTEWFAGANYEDARPITSDEAENIIDGYKPEEVEPRLFFRKKAYVLNYQHQYDGVDERYLPLLMNYGKAMCEGWSQSRWVEAGLSLEVFHAQDGYWSLEYTLVDLDGNGEDE